MNMKKIIYTSSATAIIALALGVGGYEYIAKNSLQNKSLLGINLASNKTEPPKEVEPVIVKDDILVYIETDKVKHFGDLYIKTMTNDKEKIASDVKANNYLQLFKRKSVLFLDKDNNLFLYEKGKDKEKIATNVVDNSFKASENEKTISFIKNEDINTLYANIQDGDLYVFETGKEKEKVGSNVLIHKYSISRDGSYVAYINKASELYKKTNGSVDKEKISSDVEQFYLPQSGTNIYFLNKDKALYVKASGAAEKNKISGEKVNDVQLSKDGNYVAWLEEYNEKAQKGELYFNKNGEGKQKIASDVKTYKLTADGADLYYANEDKALFSIKVATPEKIPAKDKKQAEPVKSTAQEDKVKLASNVTSISVTSTGNILAYVTQEEDLFIKLKGKEAVKEGSAAKKFFLSDDQITYLDKEKDLYWAPITITSGKNKNAKTPTTESPSIIGEKKKIASDVEDVFSDKQLTASWYFTTKNELFGKINNADAQKIFDKLDDYSHVYFSNSLLYEKKVTLKDIVGIWKPDNDTYYIEITPDSKSKFYYDGQTKNEEPFTLENRKPNSVSLVHDKTKEFGTMRVEITPDGKLSFSVGDTGTKLHTKITKEQLDKELKQYNDKKELDTKINNAKITASKIKYTYFYPNKEGINIYITPGDKSTSNTFGTLTKSSSVYVRDTYVDKQGELWCGIQVRVNDGTYYGSTRDAWVTYNSIQ